MTLMALRDGRMDGGLWRNFDHRFRPPDILGWLRCIGNVEAESDFAFVGMAGEL